MQESKRQIAEQIQRIYARFIERENLTPIAYKEELYLLIEQHVNEVIKATVRPAGIHGGIEIPPHSIQSFSVTITSSSSKSGFTLPASPIDLPNEAGVWRVYSNAAGVMDPYIPIPSDIVSLMGSTIINRLEEKSAYYIIGNRVEFTSDIANGEDIPATVELITFDLSAYGADSGLPISPDLKSTIIRSVLDTISQGRFSQTELNADNGN